LINKLAAQTKGKKLLDYGCGFGNLLSRAEKQGFEVEGIDANQQAIDVLKKKGLKARQSWSMKEAAFPDSYFDCIVALDSFYYTWDPYECLKEFHRVLTPSGILAMRISNKKYYVKAILSIIRPGPRQEAMLEKCVRKQFHLVSIASLETILNNVGFKVIEIKGAPTAPISQFKWAGRISYICAEMVRLLSFNKITIYPGVALLAQKT
jgi:2-polyprenyl-3-methyl-5-hydroxy-6-metoxy-1,4-benzoquinol methylase